MLFNLLGFFAEAEETGTPENNMGWVTWVIFGLLLVGLVLMMIIPGRKQKKRNEEMMSRLELGCIVTTIGGIVGEVIELDDTHIWLLTGSGENKSTMQFLRQAIHSIAPAPGSPEAEAIEKATKEKSEEIDEIK